MPTCLPEIIYDEIDNIPVLDSNQSLYQIPLYKNEDFFDNIESRVAFVKGCEKLIRTTDKYKKYINYLKRLVGLNHCSVLSNLTDDDATIEMHHGPILTLYDYCDIAVEYFLIKKWNISTFRIADYILDEHYANRIQVVMLSTTVHQEVHDREIFINLKQAFGDLNAFIKKHRDAITEEYIDKIDRYIDRSNLYDSNDFGVLTLSKTLYNEK